jgi:GNAT superfamily N-acetyltransferase
VRESSAILSKSSGLYDFVDLRIYVRVPSAIMSNKLNSNDLFSNSLSFPDIRPIGVDDLTDCTALSVDRGWWPERGKWSLLLEESEGWGIDAPDGQGLAGTVVLTRWGTERGAIGMMLVAARYGGHGLGRALMEHALRAAGDDAAISLYATSSGRPLYDKLGFQPVRRSVAFRGHFRLNPQANNSKKGEARGKATEEPVRRSIAYRGYFRAGPRAGWRRKERAGAAGAAGSSMAVRVATEADLPAIIAQDRVKYGADRERMLARLPGFADRIVVFEASEGIVGYAAAWRTEAFMMIGPLVAPDGAAARRLVTDLAVNSPVAVRLDLDPDRSELPNWARTCGLAPTERTVFMTRGDLTPRGIPEHVYTPYSVACA